VAGSEQMKMRRPSNTGWLTPYPGMGVYQTTFFVGDPSGGRAFG